MERKAIAIQGISTGSNYDDGACLNMMNMRHEQGVLKPVESFPVDFTLKQVYDLLYWHKNNNYSNLIGVRNHSIYWIKNEGTETEAEELLLPVLDAVVLSHTGNIINVLDGNVLKYIFWQDGDYYVINLDFESNVFQNIATTLKNTFNQHPYTISIGHTWLSYDLITHNVELNPNYFYITITGNNLYVSFQYGIYYNLTIEFRIYESDNIAYHDYTFELIPGDENLWGTALMLVEVIGYTPTPDIDFRIVKSFSPPNSGIEVNDQGVPTTGGGYWTGNLTHYYLYEDGNYPPSPIINITAYDGWQWVEHTDAGTQVYTITLPVFINDNISGVLHLTVDGLEQSHAFEMVIKNYVNTAEIILVQNADTSHTATFDSSVDDNAFHVEILNAIDTDFKITYKITDNVYQIDFTHEFTILRGSTVSDTYTVKCSNDFTALSMLSPEEERVGPVKIDLKVDGERGDTGKFRVRLLVGSDSFSYSSVLASNSDRTKRQDYTKGISAKLLSSLEKDGLLTGYFFACTAIELYDGLYIMQSNPILMGQSNDPEVRYSDLTIGTEVFNYLDNKAIIRQNSTFVKTNDDDTVERDIDSMDSFKPDSTNLEKGETIIIPNFVGLWEKRVISDNVADGVISVFSGYNKLKIKINQNVDEKYSSIIKSVSVFITPQVSQCKDTSDDKYNFIGEARFDYTSATVYNNIENYLSTVRKNSEIITALYENQRFYKVHEIPFDDIKTTAENGGWVTIDLKGKLGDNLLVQQELTTASFSNIKAGNQMTYNSMLHAWNIKNIASRGWPYSYFEQKETGIGQFPAQYTIINDYAEAKWIRVKIKTELGITEVVQGFDNIVSGTITPVSGYGDFTPVLSYPDIRATELTLYHKFGTTVKGKTYKLTPSSSGNFAYYISPDLKPISWSGLNSDTITFPKEINRELSYQNKLKVSNTNNPFIFPDAQTYPVGDGEIWNVASQSIRTSDGQFGQYPVVCFCSDGVFTLQVGDGTVAYSRVGTPQNYERPISKVLCVTPYGIAFISNRGLCMVVGQDIQYLSESMFEKFRTVTLELPEQISTLFDLDLSTFNDYLKACTAMVYNPKEQEIIMINPAKAYNYVYNMGTKQFYRNTEAITNEIDNSLPDMQVWSGTTVKKVTVVEAGSRDITFVTRPIKMQTPDMKRFERVILRAYLSGLTGAPATVCIWGSIDDRNFKLLRGMVLENNSSRKDIDFGLFGKTTYRSYIVGLSMTVNTDTEIEALEMQVEKEFLDTKMR